MARMRPTRKSVTAPRENSGGKLKPYTGERLNCRVLIMQWVRLILQNCSLSCMKSLICCLPAQQENLLILGSSSGVASVQRPMDYGGQNPDIAIARRRRA